MAEFLDDIIVYLAADSAEIGTALTFGTNLFIDFLPEAPDIAVAALSYPGSPPLYTQGDATNLPPLERPRFQILARSAKDETVTTAYIDVRNLMRGIWRSMQKIANETVNGTYYQRVEPVDSPFLLSRDESRRIIWAANFTAWRTPTS